MCEAPVADDVDDEPEADEEDEVTQQQNFSLQDEGKEVSKRQLDQRLLLVTNFVSKIDNQFFEIIKVV